MKGKKISITFRCKLIPNIPSCQQAQVKPNRSISLLMVSNLEQVSKLSDKGFSCFLCFCCFHGGPPLVGFRHSQCLQQKIPHSSYQSSHHFPSLSPLPLQSIPALLMSPAKIISFNLAALPHLKFNFYPVIYSLNSSSFRKIYNKNHFIIYFTLF